MRFLESVSSGIWVLRHRGFSKQGYALENRIGLFAVEMDRRNDGPGGLGEYVKVPKSIGDVTGAFFWPAASRSVGGWSWLFASAMLASGKNGGSGSVGAFPQFVEGGRVVVGDDRAASGGSRFGAIRSSAMLPLDSGFGFDPRWRPLVPARPRQDGVDLWPLFPTGWNGIALASSEEDQQGNLWLPCDPRLVAVNAAGDPEAGTFVVDTDKKFGVDPKRIAPLQSAFWVVRTPKDAPPAAGDSGGTAGRDGTAERTRRTLVGVNPAPTIRSPQDPFFVKFVEQEERDPSRQPDCPADGEKKKPCIDFRQRNMIALNIGLSGGKDARGGAIIDLREGTSGEAERTIGMVSKFASGPDDVGADKDDKHKLGEDEDGNPINSAHISTNAYFRKPGSDKLDAPLRFEGESKVLPRCGDFKMKVHLSYFENLHDADSCPTGGVDSKSAPAVYHPHACGAKRGIWAWWAEAKIGDETTNSQPPSPKTPAGYGSSGVITPARVTTK